MKTLTVRLQPAACIDAAEIPAALDSAEITFEPIDSLNWPNSYPYNPRAEFRIAHTGASILLHYRAWEQNIRAVAADNGRVWEDSCMEFFFMPSADDALYYNVETNCAGSVLLAVDTDRHERQKATGEILATISRWSSLGRQSFCTKEAPDMWQMAVAIPASAFFRHAIGQLSGLEASANFYKCGDLLPTPHFLSWNAIATPQPDFHRPEFFGRLIFE